MKTVAEGNLDISRQLQKQAKIKFDVGKIAKAELVQAEAEVAANVRSVRNYIDKFTEEDPETEFNSIVEEKSLLTGSDIGEFSYKSDNIEEDGIEQEQRLEEQKINE